MPMQVELVSPERILWSGESDMVVVRVSEEGYIAFQPGHAPFIGALTEHECRIYPTGDSSHQVRAAVHGGFVEVRDNRVIILSDIAEMADDIDLDRARARARDLEEQLRHEHDAQCEAMLRRDHVRIEVAGGLSGH
ncbi:MAG: ATP synthase F1 subunit epsilon [Actinobacteria bacterium]|nr:ATP synthase F1 subunit epsilon [Actinomycetota bacterium]